MSSARDTRQRAAARAKLEREMAARAEAARRKRLMQARIGAGVAGVVVLAAVVWIIAASGGDSQPTSNPSIGPAECTWTPQVEPGPSASLPPGIKDVGLPPTKPPQRGFQVLTFETNHGAIKVEMDLSKTPCTAASLAYLAGQKFYDGSSCHRLVKEIFALQCGDPSGTGSGGATYRFNDENLPTGRVPAYTEGNVAMANTGQPGTNGSQFFFLWSTSSLQGDYTLFGKVIEGLDIVKKIGAGGDDGAFAQQAGGGHPNIAISFKTVRAGPVTPESAAKPATAPPTSPGASAPAATPSATPAP